MHQRPSSGTRPSLPPTPCDPLAPSQFHGSTLLAGQEGTECLMYSFAPPNSGGAVGGCSPCAAHHGEAAGGEAAVVRDGRSGRKKKGPSKKQTRYPKRATR